MNVIHMTIEQAKDFMVSYHMINIKEQPSGKEGLLKVFERIKSIQYDPLNIVGRNSDLVLQSRIKNYNPYLLEDALYKDRILIDAWDKQMCIYQTKDFPFFNRMRKLRGEEALDSLKQYLSIEALDYVENIIDYIKVKGPTYSSEIKLGETKSHQWGNTKPSNVTLDYLFHIGRLGINYKKNTQKQYDLIENLIDHKYLDDSIIDTDEEFIQWYLLRRIASLGLASLKNGVMWSGYLISNQKTRNKYINMLFEKKMITKVIVDGLGESLYCLTEALKKQNQIQKQISFIAPLDNLIWDRNLIKKLFDFDYTWEVYVPLAKRKYGYYVLPILYGSNFIGRIEFEMHRNHEELKVKNIWWEERSHTIENLEDHLKEALSRFSRYLISEIDI